MHTGKLLTQNALHKVTNATEKPAARTATNALLTPIGYVIFCLFWRRISRSRLTNIHIHTGFARQVEIIIIHVDWTVAAVCM